MKTYSAEQEAEILQTLSDFHKEVWGSRPRLEGMNREEKLALYEKTCATLDKRKSTPEGRRLLRRDGWMIPEPITDEIKQKLMAEPIELNDLNAPLLETQGFIVIGITEQRGYLLGVRGNEVRDYIDVEIGVKDAPFGASSNPYKPKTLAQTIRELCPKQQVLFLSFPDRDQENLESLAGELLYGKDRQIKAIHERLTGVPDTCLRFDPFDL